MFGRTVTLAVVSVVCLIFVACSPLGVSETGMVTPAGPSSDDKAQVADTGEEAAVIDTSVPDEIVNRAVDDLSNRLDITVEAIDVLEVRPVTWPDASLGCAKPGESYAQTLQEGLLIRLSAGGEMYFYHSGAGQEAFLCEETSQIVPRMTPKVDEFVPPPDSEID